MLSSATHISKITGQVTILLHVLWDSREDQVRIWNIHSSQWFRQNDADFSCKLMNLMQKSLLELRAEGHHQLPPLMTVSRHCQTVCRLEQTVCFERPDKVKIQQVSDPEQSLSGIISSQCLF